MRRRVPALIAQVLPLLLLATAAPRAEATPMWARRYGIGCTGCHTYPSFQLNSDGLDFLRRGHRQEGDGSETNFANLLSARGEWEYVAVQHQPAPFEAPEFHFQAGGAVSKMFSAYADANVNDDFEALYLQYTHANGKDAYFTARGGKSTPVILREYADGLMASASAPLIIDDASLGANPFTPTRTSYGVDAAQRYKALYVQAGVLTGEDVPDQVAVNNHKDVFASAQLNMADSPTGVGVYYFHGGYDLAPDSTGMIEPDRYDRAALFANVTREKYRIAGAYLRGTDDLGPSDQHPKISGGYVQADVTRSEHFVPFARFDYVETEHVDEASIVRQGTIGVTASLYASDVSGGRLSAEFARRDEEGAKTNAGTVTLLWAF
ncbi:MAG TPA: hypothetical protein VFS09_08340 [Candidatus Eisenbacteria bacterium]|nr:hypothetical protein [Candidatus Eisenbacteria bacterium]